MTEMRRAQNRVNFNMAEEEIMDGEDTMVDLDEEEGKRWWVSRIANLSTLFREHKAVFSLRGSPFERIVVDPRKKPYESNLPPWEEMPALAINSRMIQKLKETNNDQQLEALKTTVDKKEVMLIQGPPGTGKTTTLWGLISILTQAHKFKFEDVFLELKPFEPMTREEKREAWLEASPWIKECDPTKYVKETCLSVPKNEVCVIKADVKTLPKILVCTPSNSALDEIVLRIKDLKLINQTGQVILPRMVRAGVKHSINPLVKDVSVQTLAGRKVNAEGRQGQVGSADALHKELTLAQVEVLREAQIVFTTLAYEPWIPM